MNDIKDILKELENLDLAELRVIKSRTEELISKKNKKTSTNISQKADLTIWVDGSFNADTGEYAYGVVVDDGVNPVFYNRRFTASPEMSSMRNVAGEIEAARFAIITAISNKAKSCHIIYDYQGIEMWATKRWRTNKAGTRAYAELFDQYKDQCNFTFEHVKGHTGVEYNEYCDALAKAALGISYGKKYNEIVEQAICNTITI
jgi:ribonuclease HI